MSGQYHSLLIKLYRKSIENYGNFFCKEERLPTHTKINMIDWDIMCSPKQSDRAGVRDPQIMNLALGAIFLCRIVSGESAWWKKALQKKYMSDNRRNCVRI